MIRERYLLRADRHANTYREILEIRTGSVRLLHPSSWRRWLQRLASTLIALAYLLLMAPLWPAVPAAMAIVGLPAGWAVLAAVATAYLAILVLILLWWEDKTLPLLAENPDASVPLEVLGVTSFGPFQELRALADGSETRVTVHGSRRKVGEAFRFGRLPTASA